MKGSGSYSSTGHHYSGPIHGQTEEGHMHPHHHGSQGGHPHSQGKPPSTYHHGSSSHYSFGSDSDRSDAYLDLDEYLEDEDEIYLQPGEPYGASLMSVEHPYDRALKVEDANRELFSIPLRRKTTTRVRIVEEYNKYYDPAGRYGTNQAVSDTEVVEGSYGGGRQSPVQLSNPSYESNTTRRISPHRGSPPR